jgi:hypothetical protein
LALNTASKLALRTEELAFRTIFDPNNRLLAYFRIKFLMNKEEVLLGEKILNLNNMLYSAENMNRIIEKTSKISLEFDKSTAYFDVFTIQKPVFLDFEITCSKTRNKVKKMIQSLDGGRATAEQTHFDFRKDTIDKMLLTCLNTTSIPILAEILKEVQEYLIYTKEGQECIEPMFYIMFSFFKLHFYNNTMVQLTLTILYTLLSLNHAKIAKLIDEVNLLDTFSEYLGLQETMEKVTDATKEVISTLRSRTRFLRIEEPKDEITPPAITVLAGLKFSNILKHIICKNRNASIIYTSKDFLQNLEKVLIIGFKLMDTLLFKSPERLKDAGSIAFHFINAKKKGYLRDEAAYIKVLCKFIMTFLMNFTDAEVLDGKLLDDIFQSNVFNRFLECLEIISPKAQEKSERLSVLDCIFGVFQCVISKARVQALSRDIVLRSIAVTFRFFPSAEKKELKDSFYLNFFENLNKILSSLKPAGEAKPVQTPEEAKEDLQIIVIHP